MEEGSDQDSQVKQEQRTSSNAFTPLKTLHVTSKTLPSESKLPQLFKSNKLSSHQKETISTISAVQDVSHRGVEQLVSQGINLGSIHATRTMKNELLPVLQQ